ncbi:hypothetical protein Tco_1233720, partial [Tanacetum coccineum]
MSTSMIRVLTFLIERLKCHIKEREEMEGQDEDEEGSREDGKSSRLR